MSQAGNDSLSADDVATLRAAVAKGERSTVYFTTAAVGVHGVRSGKVVALGDAAEGDFIQVKPAGQADVLSFSPGELALFKPRESARRSEGRSTGGSRAGKARPQPEPVKSQGGAAAAGSGTQRAHRVSSAHAARDNGAVPAKVTITVTSDEQGEWRVDALVGRRKPVRGLAVSPGAVAKAAGALASEVAEAIDDALDAAREQQRAKVERLREELQEAQQTLDELG
jgi:hypothetical protein